MARTLCPAGQWTDLGNVGETIIETRGTGGYLCLTAEKPAAFTDALSIPSDAKMVFSGPVSFHPAGPVDVNVYHSGA